MLGSAETSGATASHSNPAASLKDQAFASMAQDDISDWIKEERDRKAEDAGDQRLDGRL